MTEGRQHGPQGQIRGHLRVYLGAAPGVGKTFAMLDEGRRRRERGTDVVIALVETHGRPKTAAQVGDLDLVPRRTLEYRGARFTEMDVDAVLARAPRVALVDELAHTNVPGSRNAKRCQDVAELLDAGIDVITTVNIQHLESLNDVVERITGIRQQETIPDAVVRAADQIELVDMSPQALRRRMAHGNVYAAEKVDAALANYFRVGNLTALRELALLWLADRVDEGLQAYRAEHGIRDTWEARERVVVALPGGPQGEALIRRAARIAARTGSRLLAVHVVPSDGIARGDPAALTVQRRLVESLGGTFHQVHGDDVATAVLDVARAENATQIVLGATSHSRLYALLHGSTNHDVVRMSGSIDVHIVTHPGAATRSRRLPRLQSGLSGERQRLGLAVAAVGLPLLTVVLYQARGVLNLASDLVAYLVLTLVVSLIGGLRPALGTALISSLLLNWFFTPPLHTFTIGEPNNLIALLAFLGAAAGVSTVVDLSARRATQAARASGEAQLLATLAETALRVDDVLPALLSQVRESFGFQIVRLQHGEHVIVEETASPEDAAPAPRRPAGDPPAVETFPLGEGVTLAVQGRELTARDRRVLVAVAAQFEVVLEHQRLARRAAAAIPAIEADRMRSALLAAVSHDLRTPLAAALAAVSSLRQLDLTLTEQDRAELLATAKVSLDRLTALVVDLLDMSRLQAGAVAVLRRRVALDEVVPLVLDRLGVPAGAVRIDVPDTLPEVSTDPALLERVLANLISNALRFSPPQSPPSITASLLDAAGTERRIELRVIDHGPGIPEVDHERAFVPFQRLGDRDTTVGVGLGLAVARGLAEALGGGLEPEETPGGGLTMVVVLPMDA